MTRYGARSGQANANTPPASLKHLMSGAKWLGVFLALCSGACQELVTVTNPASEGVSTKFSAEPGQSRIVTPSNLVAVARFFAPVIYQYVGRNGNLGDLLTRVTYDGDWIATNNWENLGSFPKYAYVYVSVVEDPYRYFVHYGTYHPRDYCDGSGGHGWADLECPTPVPTGQHENDMEGVTIAVDKRFATANWPYGQILTAETITHTWYEYYHNCQLEGGFPVYFDLFNGLGRPRGGYDNGCIPFTTGYAGTTTPNAPIRFELVVDYAGHAVWMQPSATLTDQWSIKYVPTDNSPVSPAVQVNYDNRPRPISVTVTPSPTPYALQFLTDAELAGSSLSLWDQKSNTSGGPFSGTTMQLVQPQGLSYYTHFRGDTYSVNAAVAPWGQAGDGLDIGEWHNHPSWAWSRHWLPSGPYANQYYVFCQNESCHYLYTYLFNPFWNRPAPQVAISGPSIAAPFSQVTWSAVISRGAPPFTYQWFLNGSLVGTAQSLTLTTGGSDFTLRVDVRDPQGVLGTSSSEITVSSCPPPQITCD